MDSTARPEERSTVPHGRPRPGEAGLADPLAAGDRLGERYLVTDVLGRGGFATVYRARDLVLGRDVALKILRPGGAGGTSEEDLARQLESEGRMLARLDHANVARVHEAGRLDGHLFLSMELVPGRSLAEVILVHGTLGFARALGILRQVAAALDHAHALGIVHRDVTPSNVLVGPGDDVRLVDFGIARLARDLRSSSGQGVAGTHHFIAPEILSGSSPDPRSDLFALAATFVASLVGYDALESCSTAAGGAVDDRIEAASLGRLGPDVPRGVAAVLANALSPEPALRPSSAAELVRALERFGKGRRMRRRLAWGLPPAAIVALVAGAAAWHARPIGLEATLVAMPARSGGPVTRVPPGTAVSLSSGDTFWFEGIRAKRGAHVLVLLVDGRGRADWLPMETPDREAAAVGASEIVRLPVNDAWRLDTHAGRETLFVVASRTPPGVAERKLAEDAVRRAVSAGAETRVTVRGVEGLVRSGSDRDAADARAEAELRARFDAVATFVIDHR